MIVGDEVTSYVSLQNVDKENAFSEADIRLLETLANSMSVALENARLFDETQRLLKETEQRNAELAIINSVQEGLASKLDMQAIYDLVGDKLCEVFHSQDLNIRLYDPVTGLINIPYAKEHGRRLEILPRPFAGLARHVIETRRTLVINEDMQRRTAEIDAPIVPGTDDEKSLMAVPIIAG